MNTKTCNRCGWVYPITQPGTKCLICGANFDKVICRKCEAIFDYNGTTLCPKCTSKLRYNAARKYTLKHSEKLKGRFKQWLDKVKLVPKDYPTLTEAQWLEACSFFNGCARCDSEDIDTRGFFISSHNGGRYCDWNIIPLCQHCAKVWNIDSNPFSSAYHRDIVKNARGKRYVYLGDRNNRREFQDNLDRLTKYLEVKLDDAISVHKSTTEHTE